MDVSGLDSEFYSFGTTYDRDILVFGTAQEGISSNQGEQSRGHYLRVMNIVVIKSIVLTLLAFEYRVLDLNLTLPIGTGVSSVCAGPSNYLIILSPSFRSSTSLEIWHRLG